MFRKIEVYVEFLKKHLGGKNHSPESTDRVDEEFSASLQSRTPDPAESSLTAQPTFPQNLPARST